MGGLSQNKKRDWSKINSKRQTNTRKTRIASAAIPAEASSNPSERKSQYPAAPKSRITNPI